MYFYLLVIFSISFSPGKFFIESVTAHQGWSKMLKVLTPNWWSFYSVNHWNFPKPRTAEETVSQWTPGGLATVQKSSSSFGLQHFTCANTVSLGISTLREILQVPPLSSPGLSGAPPVKPGAGVWTQQHSCLHGSQGPLASNDVCAPAVWVTHSVRDGDALIGPVLIKNIIVGRRGWWRHH